MYSQRTVDSEVLFTKLEITRGRLLSFCAHVALVDGLLIDSGFTRAQRSLLRALAGQRVERVACTHAHEDHFGNHAVLAARFGASLYGPAASLEVMREPAQYTRAFYQRFMWGYPEPCEAQPLPEVLETERFRFQVIPTPGHSFDHVCFFEPQRGWLFSGDLYLSVKVRMARFIENAGDMLGSLKKVRDLEPRFLFCAHAGLVEDPIAALGAKIDFMEELGGEVRRLHDSGAAAVEIAHRVLGRDPLPLRLLAAGDVSKHQLVKAFLKSPGEGYNYPVG